MSSGSSRQTKLGVKTRLLTLGVTLLTVGLACGGQSAAAETTHHKKAVVHHTVAVAHTTKQVPVTKHVVRPKVHAKDHQSNLHQAVYHPAAANEQDYRRYITYYSHDKRHRRLHYASAHYWHSGIQCVPYAREVSHIDLSGNAFLWWAEASGRYARGNVPQEGAVLNFRAIGRMPLGHVAVVTSVIDPRTILVTQANWIRGSITNDVTMQDVSANNDWSEVEVELGDSSTWGAPYPTYGFIYNKPDNGLAPATGTVIAAAAQGNEVAEAPAAAPVSTDAPDRNLQ